LTGFHSDIITQCYTVIRLLASHKGLGFNYPFGDYALY
jgi:hypothetical protein